MTAKPAVSGSVSTARVATASVATASVASPSVGNPSVATASVVNPRLALLLLVVSIFAPLSMDLYMPGLPLIGYSFGVGAALVNFTVTATLIGLALGKLVGGPVSDRFGRRRTVLAGVIAYVALALVSALVPSIEALIVLRLVKGVAAGFAIISAQAAGRDLYDGQGLARFYARIGMAAGITAAVSPQIGAGLLRFFDWRGLFVALAVIGALILVAAAVMFAETLPAGNRAAGGLRTTVAQFAGLRQDRVFVGAILLAALFAAALFGYIASAAFVLQGLFGLTPQLFAVVVGVIASGMVGAGFLGGRLAGRCGPLLPIRAAIGAVGAGGLVLLAGAVTASLPLPVAIAALFTVGVGTAIAMPATSTLAVAGYPHAAGTATAVLGVSRFAAGALIAPLVGLGGGASVLPLGLALTVIATLAIVTSRLITPRRDAPSARQDGAATSPVAAADGAPTIFNDAPADDPGRAAPLPRYHQDNRNRHTITRITR